MATKLFQHLLLPSPNSFIACGQILLNFVSSKFVFYYNRVLFLSELPGSQLLQPALPGSLCVLCYQLHSSLLQGNSAGGVFSIFDYTYYIQLYYNNTIVLIYNYICTITYKLHYSCVCVWVCVCIHRHMYICILMCLQLYRKPCLRYLLYSTNLTLLTYVLYSIH